MQSENGYPKFCEGCPAANAVRGDITEMFSSGRTHRYVDDTFGDRLVLDIPVRTIWLADDEGRLSVPIAGSPENYTAEGDMQRTAENVRSCEGPRRRTVEYRVGSWLFGRMEEEAQVRCGTIGGWKRDKKKYRS